MKAPAAYHAGQFLVHDIRAMARALGGQIVNGRQLVCPGPGHSASDRSLAVWLTSDGNFGVHSHAGDDWALCKDYVRERLGLPQWRPGDGRDRRVEPSRLKAFDRAAVNAESERRERTEDDLIRIERARAIWHDAIEPRGTLVETYLATRALVLGDDFMHRAAVKLAPASDVLHVGEGIETCMAARQLGYAPAWALGSAGMITHFPVIDGVNTLRILGERCAANANAVDLCAQRWHAAGRKAQVGLPKDARDKDFNDQLMRQAS